MIGPTGTVRVMMATKPVDFRKGAEGLAALVRETMKSDPFSGAVYVFRAKRAEPEINRQRDTLPCREVRRANASKRARHPERAGDRWVPARRYHFWPA